MDGSHLRALQQPGHVRLRVTLDDQAVTAYASAEDQHIRALGNWQTSRLRLAASLGRLGLQMI
nr:hypothetical protein [Pseudomonas aeruginosa]